MSRLLPLSLSDRGDRTLVAGLALAAVLVALRLDDVPVGAVTDDAYYVEMARSVAEGLGPVLQVGPGGATEEPDIFPPGFPLLLAPLAALRPDSLSILKVVPILAAVAFAALAWAYPPQGRNRGLRGAVLAVTALSPWLVGWAGRILSDLPYAALALAGLLAAARSLERERGRPGDLVIAGVLVGAAVAVRTVGWSTVLAIAAVAIAERRWRSLPGFVVGAAAVLLPVWLATGTGPVSAAYSTQMAGDGGPATWRFALENGLRYVGRLPVLLVPVFGAPLQAMFARWHLGALYPAGAFAVGLGLLLLAGRAACVGWRASVSRIRVRLAIFTILLTAVALVNFHGYPSPIQTRLLLPLLPMLVWLVLQGTWTRPRAARALVGLMLVAALAHNGWRVARPMRSTTNPDGTGLVDPGLGADWVRAHSAADAVVMAPDPLQRHIHLRRPVVAPPTALRPDALDSVVVLHQVQIVLVGPAVHGRPRQLVAAGADLLAALGARPDRFRRTHTDSGAALTIFRVENRE